MKAIIPNCITLLNLFCGCAAIVCLLDLQLLWAFWFLLAAGLLDVADGLVARLLGVSSEIGKELDSLADMVSFGVVPGVIYYVFLDLQSSHVDGLAAKYQVSWNWYASPAFLVPMFSALRLAKFNIDDRQTDGFLGIATPTSTLFAVGLMLIYATDTFGWGARILSPWVLYPSIFITSALLVAEIPMFSFKMKDFGWPGNQIRYIFVALTVLLVFLFKQAALPFIVFTYLILNISSWLITQQLEENKPS